MVASRVPLTGDLAHNPGCALTGKPTSGPLVCGPGLNPLSYTSQGRNSSVFKQRFPPFLKDQPGTNNKQYREEKVYANLKISSVMLVCNVLCGCDIVVFL